MKKSIFFAISLIGVIISMWMMLFATTLFYTGYHNLDIGQNMRYLNAEFDLNLVDIYDYDKFANSQYAYSKGVEQIRLGFITLGSSACLFGYCVGLLIMFTPKDKKKKKSK